MSARATTITLATRTLVMPALALRVLGAHALGAQDLAVKRPRISAITIACHASPPGPALAPQQREEANRLSTLAQQAVLEGDHKSAASLYRQAAQLDPHDATLAYRLGREDEELSDSAAAVREYCRYIALAPDAGDAPQVTERITKLLPIAILRRGEDAQRAFQGGVAHYDEHDWGGAAAAFTTVMAIDSTLPAPVFDRALARANDGDEAGAVRDFNRYLALDPTAHDAPAVRDQIDAFRRHAPHAGTAVALGILPGGGQFYTGQPVLGAATLAAAGAGIALALQSTKVTGVHTVTYQFPFGGSYQQQVPFTQSQHQNAGIGLAAAGGVTIAGMIEAAIIAHHRSRSLAEPTTPPAASLSPALFPTPDGRLAVGLSLTP